MENAGDVVEAQDDDGDPHGSVRTSASLAWTKLAREAVKESSQSQPRVDGL